MQCSPSLHNNHIDPLILRISLQNNLLGLPKAPWSKESNPSHPHVPQLARPHPTLIPATPLINLGTSPITSYLLLLCQKLYLSNLTRVLFQITADATGFLLLPASEIKARRVSGGVGRAGSVPSLLPRTPAHQSWGRTGMEGWGRRKVEW